MLLLCKLKEVHISLILLCLVHFPAGDSVEVADEATPVPDTTNSKELNVDKCNRKRVGCCEEMDLGDDATLMKCFTLLQGKLPPDGSSDPVKVLQFLSCLVECIYKQKKYLGKGDRLNMRMIKADADRSFPNRTKEKEYHVQMYEYCGKDGANTYNMVKQNPAGRLMLKDTCKPYFMFVFLCQSDYPKKHGCPYFKWKGKRKTPEAETCEEAKNKCYESEGISI